MKYLRGFGICKIERVRDDWYKIVSNVGNKVMVIYRKQDWIDSESLLVKSQVQR